MSEYNLTENQKKLIKLIVEEIKNEKIPEEFWLHWSLDGLRINKYTGDRLSEFQPICTQIALRALEKQELLFIDKKSTSYYYVCSVTGKAYQAVESNFNEPDTSFIKHITPLADLTDLDKDLKERCLPTLSSNASDPKQWDTAITTAVKILEDRIKKVGGITDDNLHGQKLVNQVFTERGTLAHKFNPEAKREGYRNLYAGFMGVFRNNYAHKFIDPIPENGGKIIVFIDLLLKQLDNLN